MDLKQITYQSDLYYKVVQLRQQILRTPLGLKFSEDDLAIDKDEILFSLIDSDQPVACLQVRTIDKLRVKLRQMAVDRKFQRQGLGKLLIQKVEKHFKMQGVKSIELNARQTAVGFYHKLGYHIVSEKFTEVGIPHYTMIKNL